MDGQKQNTIWIGNIEREREGINYITYRLTCMCIVNKKFYFFMI